MILTPSPPRGRQAISGEILRWGWATGIYRVKTTYAAKQPAMHRASLIATNSPDVPRAVAEKLSSKLKKNETQTYSRPFDSNNFGSTHSPV